REAARAEAEAGTTESHSPATESHSPSTESHSPATESHAATPDAGAREAAAAAETAASAPAALSEGIMPQHKNDCQCCSTDSKKSFHVALLYCPNCSCPLFCASPPL